MFLPFVFQKELSLQDSILFGDREACQLSKLLILYIAYIPVYNNRCVTIYTERERALIVISNPTNDCGDDDNYGNKMINVYGVVVIVISLKKILQCCHNYIDFE